MTHPTDRSGAGSGARWRGYSHRELYAMLHDGPGAAASADPSRRWAEISTTLTEIGQDLRKALDLSGTGWSGPAAGAAYERLSTTVAWAADAGASAGVMRTSVEEQAEHIAKARADMPTPQEAPATQPDPTVAAAAQVVQTQTDLEPSEAAATTGEEKAVEVMATYEASTNTTTAALASFTTPADLLPRGEVHHRGGGMLNILPTVASGLLGWRPRQDERRNEHRNWRPSEHHRGGGWHYSPGTSGSSASWDEATRRPLTAPTTAPAPGKLTGAAINPLLGPGGSANRSQEEPNSSGRGGGNGGGNGNAGPGGPRPGSTTMGGLPPSDLQQAAAASQAAAHGANPAAGTPLAPTAGGPGGGAQDKLGVRRFGMEAIGSSQWFGDADEPVVGQSPRRRFDTKESDEVTESVSILGEEHKLPPNVIGDGR